MAAAVGIITDKIGEVETQFGLLSMKDLATITAQIPPAFNPSGEIIDLSALSKWSKHVIGCEQVLFVAAQKVSPTVTREAVASYGSLIRRTNLADRIFIASITNGEEPRNEPAET